MGIENFIGASDPFKSSTTGIFDPFRLSAGKDDETLSWYRAAELKHGRVSMLATLGIFIQGLNTGILPNSAFSETDPIAALKKVYYENPGALLQVRKTKIIMFINLTFYDLILFINFANISKDHFSNSGS
jgi:hypothetical protein